MTPVDNDPDVTNIVQLAEAVAQECEGLQLTADTVAAMDISQLEHTDQLIDLLAPSIGELTIKFIYTMFSGYITLLHKLHTFLINMLYVVTYLLIDITELKRTENRLK